MQRRRGTSSDGFLDAKAGDLKASVLDPCSNRIIFPNKSPFVCFEVSCEN